MKLNRTRFILVLTFGLLLYYFNSYSTDVVNGICLILILLFGIPHGAVDHRIHLTTSTGNRVGIYILKYVLIAAAYILWWIMDPTKALVLFILLSAYHFGQEALEDAEIKQPGAIDSLIWGAIILVAPMLFNFSEVKPYLEIIVSSKLPELGSFVKYGIPALILIAGIIHLFFNKIQGRISNANVLKLAFFLLTIIALHQLLPFVLAFTIYFVFFHSFNAFTHQFNWLKEHKKNYSLQRFILDLSGFSVLAVIGMVLLLWVLNPKGVDSLITYFFILTSLITLPHAITLDQFYKFKRSQISQSGL